MKAIFLSDAHLRDPQDRNYQLLLEFLNRQKDLDALFLLGDIFEFWIGYKNVAFSAYIPLLGSLKELSERGTRLYFVEGNHDFNMGPYFTRELNCTVIADQRLIEWDGRKLLVCHGDLLNPDPAYRRLRALWRSRPVRVLSRLVHPDLVWSFALWLCNKSAKNNPERSHRDPTAYLKKFSEQRPTDGADAVICGHYHHAVETSHKGVELIALGDWISQFSYAEMIDGKITLKNYPA